MKINRMILFLFGVSLCGCFDDKGNYDYRDMADITIENIPEVIEGLGNSDHIIVTPKVVSSLDGEVKEGDANFAARIWAGSGRTPTAWMSSRPLLQRCKTETQSALYRERCRALFYGGRQTNKKRSPVQVGKRFLFVRFRTG